MLHYYSLWLFLLIEPHGAEKPIFSPHRLSIPYPYLFIVQPGHFMGRLGLLREMALSF